MVRVSLLFVSEKDEITAKRLDKLDKSNAKPFDISELESVADNLQRAVELNNLTEPANYYAMQVFDNQEYLVESEDLAKLQENSLVLLQVSPIIRAENFLSAISGESNDLKQKMFDLRFFVQDTGFAEELIDRNGIEILLKLINNTNQKNIQAYGLTAVRCLMGYYNGLQNVLDRPELVDMLFGLVSATAVTVSRQAVELLFVLCNYNGWELVNNAAKTVADQNGTEPYREIVAMLEQNDLNSRLNALTLLNSVLTNAPNPDILQELVFRWRDQFHLAGIIQKQREVKDKEFSTQLDLFYTTTAQFLEAPTLSKASQLAEYEAQQPLLQVLVSELTHCHQVIQAAQDSGAFVSGRAPTKRFEKQRTWTAVDRPVDLNFLNSHNEAIGDELNRLNRRTSFAQSSSRNRSRIEVKGTNSEPVTKPQEDEPVRNNISLEKPIEEPVSTISLEKPVEEEPVSTISLDKEEKTEDESEASEAEKSESIVTMTDEERMELNSKIEEKERTLEEKERALEEKESLLNDTRNQMEKLKTKQSENDKIFQQKDAIIQEKEQQAATLQKRIAELENKVKQLEENPQVIQVVSPSNNSEASTTTDNTLVPNEGEPIPSEDSTIPPPSGDIPPAPGPPPPPGVGAPGPPPPLPGGGPPGPPPPPGSGAPPPPGLPSMSSAAIPTKPVVKPNTKMKPLFWKRIILQNDQKNVFWNNIDEIEFDIDELEDQFAAKQTIKKMGSSANLNGDSGPSKPKAISLLDPKKANAIAIMINSLPSTSDVVTAIKNLDTNIIKRDQIGMILNNVPTAEEIDAICSHPSDGPSLDKPDIFCLGLSEIDNLEDRLKCWIFKLSCKDRFKDINPPLSIVQKAANELKSSEKLKKVMGLVLAIGNYLNGGSKRGQADGFQLEILPKLNDTKGSSGDTLLMYMMKLIKKSHPNLVSLPDDVSHVAECTRINLKDIDSLANKLNGEINLFKKQVEKVNSKSGGNDTFGNVMTSFVSEVTKEIEQAQKNVEDTINTFEETIKFFDARKGIASNEFFALFDTFLNYFKACSDQYDAELLKEEKQKARGTMVKRENAGKKIGGGGNDGDPMMGIIAAIRAGKASGLKKSDLPESRASTTEGGESQGNPFAFKLKKVERPPPKEKEPEQMNELQRMLSKRQV